MPTSLSFGKYCSLFVILATFVFLSYVPSYTQINFPIKSSTKEFTPATPEATALGQYGNAPVSYHTGIPNIEIPIFNLSLKSFSFPISISYHAGGIRVDQVSSRVGIGWTLNAGGSISISTLSKSDFTYPLWEMPPAPWSFATPVGEFRGITTQPYFDMMNDPTLGYHFLRGYFENSFNTSARTTNFEPDDINYNFAGYSGKIIRNKNAFLFYETLPQSGLEIEDDLDIIDENGTRFYFKDIESSGSADPYQVSYNYYLSKVKTKEGDSIVFNYENEFHCYFTSKQETVYTLTPNYNGCTIPVEFNPINYNFQRVDSKRIKQIKASNGYQIDFEYNAMERPDLKGSQALRSIIVRFNSGGTLTQLTRFDLHQTNSQTSNNNLICSTPNVLNDNTLGPRLRLDSIKQFGVPAYKFFYNSRSLPPRLSNQQDLWGYANENTANTLVPSIARLGYTNGADRSPNADAMKAGSLQKIQYPTGGTLELDLEPNQYFTTGEETMGNGSLPFTTPGNQNSSSSFTLPSTVFGNVEVSYVFAPSTQAAITHLPTNTTILVDNNSGSNGSTTFPSKPGAYNITINNFSSNTTAQLVLKWITLDSLKNVNRIGGGLRVKEIRSYSLTGQLASRRTFEYVIPGTTMSSALVDKIPTPYYHFADRDKKWIARDPGPPYYNSACFYSAIFSNDVSMYQPRQASTGFGYEYVTEYNLDAQNGKTIYRYLRPESLISGGSFIDPDIAGAIKGKLIEKLDYSWQANSFNLLRQETNDYKISLTDPNIYPKGYKFDLLSGQVDEVPPSSFVHYFIPATFFIGQYNVQNLRLDLIKKTIREYTPTAAQTEIFYKYVDFLVAQEKKLVGSDSLIIQNEYYLENRTQAPFTKFLNKPTKISSIRRRANNPNEVMDMKRLDYQLISGMLLPKEIFYMQNTDLVSGSTANANLNSRVLFEQYDSKGNLLSMVDQSYIRTSFIWGYDKNLLTAEVKNARLNEIFHTSFENEEGGNSTEGDARTGLKSKTDGYAKTLTGLTTNKAYVLTYWQKNATVWTLQTVNIAASASTTYTINLTGQVDEVRFFPQGALMTTYTYRPGVGITSACDPKGLITTFEYDTMNRLWYVKDHLGNILKEHKYNYKQ